MRRLISGERDSYNATDSTTMVRKYRYARATFIQQEEISKGSSAESFYEASISAAAFAVVWRARSGFAVAENL